MDLHQRLLAGFHQHFGGNPEFVACAPGRVNLLGEHIDYNDGFVLPAAIDRVTLVAFRRSGSACSTLFALDLNAQTSFNLHSIQEKTDSNGNLLSGWASYPAGVLWGINAEGLDTPGMEAVFSSNVPIGAGLSSSASVEVAFGVAWEKLGGWSIPPINLARICQNAEVQYVGVNCGIMDQFASACGVDDRILYLDCRSLDWRSLPLPENAVIVVADTSIRRSLTASAYNDRHAACNEAVQILRLVMPRIQSLRDVPLEQFRRYSRLLPETVSKRAQHVIEEITRTQNAVESLENNDAVQFGEFMNACHASLRDLYEVSGPELDVMVAQAQSIPGCYGARLTGAGFGGCTVNLVASPAVEAFAHHLSTGFLKKTGLKSKIYICHAVNGARVEDFQMNR
jgi:galactokinase